MRREELQQRLDGIEQWFAQALPVALAEALDALADGLDAESSGDQSRGAAALHLRIAARLAFHDGDLERARIHFNAALAAIDVSSDGVT